MDSETEKLLDQIESEIKQVLEPYMDVALTPEHLDEIADKLLKISEKYESDEELSDFVILVSDSLEFAIMAPEEEA